jgi:hypothetical protein
MGQGRRRRSFALIVHHTDAVREWAYDRNSTIGHLDKALDAAQAMGWTDHRPRRPDRVAPCPLGVQSLAPRLREARLCSDESDLSFDTG